MNPYDFQTFSPLRPMFGQGMQPYRPENPYESLFPYNMNPQEETEQTPSPTPRPVGMPQNYMSVLAELQNQQGPATDAYKKHLASMPSRDTVHAGWMDSIGAALAGASEGWRRGAGAGYDTARKIIDNPYNQAVGDWQVKGQALATNADQEQQDMARKIAFVRTINDMQNKAEELRLRGDEVAARKLESEARAKYYQFQTTGKLTFEDVGGKKVALNPQGDVVKTLGDTEGALNRSQENVNLDKRFNFERGQQTNQQSFSQAQQDRTFKHEEKLAEAATANKAIEQATAIENREVPVLELNQSRERALQDVAGRNPQWAGFVKVTKDKNNKTTSVEGVPPNGNVQDPEYMKFWDEVKKVERGLATAKNKDLKTTPAPTKQDTTTPAKAGTSSVSANIPKATEVLPEKRVVGQPYQMVDGNVRIWTGSGWRAQ